jgi:multicomponent K+:H+ antiporter subunit F
MTAAVLPFVTLAFVLGLLLSAYRLVRGPSIPDRILALDTLYMNALALLVLLGIVLDTKLYFEAALVIALLAFVGTVALARFVLRGDIIEPTQ